MTESAFKFVEIPGVMEINAPNASEEPEIALAEPEIALGESAELAELTESESEAEICSETHSETLSEALAEPFSTLAAPPTPLPTLRPFVLDPPPAPAGSKTDRRTQNLLEVHIGIPVIVEALEFSLAGEPSPEYDADQQLIAPLSPLRMLYERLHDPALSRRPITENMRACRVKIADLLLAIGNRNLQLAIFESSRRVSTVLDGLGEAAEPRDVPCPRCKGEGVLEITPDFSAFSGEGEPAPDTPREVCAQCSGSGKVRKYGDLDAAKLFLGVQGLNVGGKSAPGSTTNVNVLAQASAKSDTISRARDTEPITIRVQKLIEGS